MRIKMVNLVWIMGFAKNSEGFDDENWKETEVK